MADKMAEGFPKIMILTGPEEGATFVLPPSGTLSIGRSDENQIALEDSSVSRQHATLILREGKCFLRDEQSRNGTILEDKKLVPLEEVLLQHLDEFRLGIYEIRYAERVFTDADVQAKKTTAVARKRPIEQADQNQKSEIAMAEAAPLAQKSVPPLSSEAKPAQKSETPEVESLLQGILEEKAHVEDKLPPPKKTRHRLWLWMGVVIVLLVLVLSIVLWFRTQPTSEPELVAVTETQSKPLPTAPQIPPSSTPPLIRGAGGITLNQNFNVFLDVTTQPLPATIFLEEERLGITPLKTNVAVMAGKTYQLYADFELRDAHDVYRQKIPLPVKPNSDVVELKISAEIGTLKITRLPERVEFNLEGFYDYDRAQKAPVKISHVAYGVPIFLPYGRYRMELREITGVVGSENKISVVRYQRELDFNKDNPTMEFNITDKDLKFFPVVIKSDPSAATLLNNGEVIGKTPFQGVLPVGKNQLKVSKQGFFDKTVDIDMPMNSVYESTIILETSKVGELLNKARDLIRNDDPQQALVVLIDALKYGGSTKEKSEIYFLLGKTYFATAQYESALTYYQKAGANADDAVWANIEIAKTYHALKKDAQALETIVTILVKVDQQTPAEVRAAANNVFKEISGLNSVVYVYSEPPGADVYLNDRKLAQVTPLIVSDLTLGTYRVTIAKPGYETFEVRQAMKLGEFVMVKTRLKKSH